MIAPRSFAVLTTLVTCWLPSNLATRADTTVVSGRHTGVSPGVSLPSASASCDVVPLTRTIRKSGTEVAIDPEGDNGIGAPSSAQCQQLRSVATIRVSERTGNVGPVVLGEVREMLARLLVL